MKKYILIILLLFFNQLKAQDNLKFYIKKALDNNLQLNAERKNLSLQSKVKIFLEVSFYQASLSLEIKPAQPLQIVQIKVEPV